MTIILNKATNASVDILKRTNALFGIVQKRVATGKQIFNSADDTTRYHASETLLTRARQLNSMNDNISLGLATLEATDKTLSNMRGLVDSAIALVTKAQNEGGDGARATVTTANIATTDVVTGISIGSKFSITSDSGQNFTYTFNSLGVTWGEIANALNSSGIGVIAEFIPSSVAGQTNLRFRATNDEDFTFDAVSDQNAMDDLVGMTTPTGQVFNAVNLFANGLAAPAAGETGFTVGYGGQITGNAGGGVTLATPIAAGSTITFQDGLGGYRSLSYGAATTVAQVITDITAMGAGIKAELVNQTGGPGGPLQLRLRNMNGGNMFIAGATGDFAAAGSVGFPGISTSFAAPLSVNNALRLAYGQQYDSIIENLDALVANNPVPVGRNLLLGEDVNVMLDEFAGNPLRLAGIVVTATGTLTMVQPGSTWTNDQNIQTSAGQARQAQKVLLDIQNQFGSFVSYIKSRYDLNKSYQSESKTQGDELVAADISEESASLVALQTRQQFAVEAISVGNQNLQSMLRLLG